MTLLLPALSSSRNAAKGIRCLGSLKQCYTYAINYSEASNGWNITLSTNFDTFWSIAYCRQLGLTAQNMRNILTCSEYTPYVFELSSDPSSGGKSYGGHGGRWTNEPSSVNQYFSGSCVRLLYYPNPEKLILFADSAHPSSSALYPAQSYTLYSGQRIHLRHSRRANIITGAGDARSSNISELKQKYYVSSALGPDLETL